MDASLHKRLLKSEYNKQYREKNRERLLQIDRERYQANKEKVAEYNASRKEQRSEYNKKYHAENKDRLNAARSYRYFANIDAERERQAKYNEKNKEMRARSNAEWYASHPDAVRVKNSNRRKRIGSGRLSVGITYKLMRLQKKRCACCHKLLGSGFHLDHIMPLALGGTNTDDNMQLLCAPCNQKKHAKHPVEFMQSRGYLL